MTQIPEISREENIAFWREQLAGIEQDLNAAMAMKALDFSSLRRSEERVEELWNQFRTAKRKLAEVENELL